MNDGRITVLVKNTAGGRGLLAEHGMSFWIESGSHRILFDTGQSDVLLHNAQILGINLSAVNAIVLSQGHYDHVGRPKMALEPAPARKPRANSGMPSRRRYGVCNVGTRTGY